MRVTELFPIIIYFPAWAIHALTQFIRHPTGHKSSHFSGDSWAFKTSDGYPQGPRVATSLMDRGKLGDKREDGYSQPFITLFICTREYVLCLLFPHRAIEVQHHWSAFSEVYPNSRHKHHAESNTKNRIQWVFRRVKIQRTKIQTCIKGLSQVTTT